MLFIKKYLMVVVKNYIPHSKLSNKIWSENMIMKDEIKKQLLVISEYFIDYLAIAIDVLDITMTGSYANYNYTKYSDIDLHIIVDYEEVSDVEDLSKEFFNAKKSFWNDNHDIKLKGIEVELYAQDVNEKHSSTGVYSLMFNKWLIEPKKFKTNIDISSIKEKYKKVKKEIDETVAQSIKHKNYKLLDSMLKKIKNMRKSGLERAGELSDENLIYKVLRDNNDLQNLFDIKNNLFDDNLSLI